MKYYIFLLSILKDFPHSVNLQVNGRSEPTCWRISSFYGALIKLIKHRLRAVKVSYLKKEVYKVLPCFIGSKDRH